MSFFNISDAKRKQREYIREYQRICNTITESDIYNKQIILEYNDGVPDMFIEIPIEGNEFVSSIMYDIYNKRLNRYGNDYQSRLQGKRECQFEFYLKKSVYYTIFEYNGQEIEGSFEGIWHRGHHSGGLHDHSHGEVHVLLPQADFECASLPDSVFLRRGLLRPAGASGGA